VPHQAFPRRLRLLTAGDYRGVFDRAAFKVHGKGMMALATPNGRCHPRLGLIVSRRNVRRAVDRNRFKRLVRESLRLRQEHLPPVDVVVLARRGVQELDNDQLRRQLHGLWKRLAREARKTETGT
jgi:ribonuclease P protein component